MKNKKNIIILILIVTAMIILYFTNSTINKFVTESVSVLIKLDIDRLIDYIRGFGVYAILISSILMIMQSIISPIPAFLITLANAAIFGWQLGALISFISSMLGAALCFYISRILGRDIAVKLTGVKALKSVDYFFEIYGKYAILIARLLPFVSFDLVSYAAGLTSLSFISFFIATAIGQLPATIIYSYAGGALTGGSKMLFTGLSILFAISIIFYVGKQYYNEKKQNNQNN